MSRIPKPRLKTLGQLVAGRTRKVERHVHQFQIACLELERTRRTKELTAALRHVEELYQRLGEIGQEIEQRRMDMAPVVAMVYRTPPAVVGSSPGMAASPAEVAGPRRAAPRRTLRY